ncbi:hypothetical protein H6770_04515 [Candidatus Peribacteria bacterium]|nr:hypothetical protein [Candidatus Peribacteria bacterium]
MTKHNERESIEVLHALVKQYEEPGLPGQALQRLATLAQAMQIVSAQGNTLVSTDDTIAKRVEALAESLRPYLEAVLGPTIGRLKHNAVAKIMAEIKTHEARKNIIGDAELDKLSNAAEDFHIGKLEHELKIIETLFQRFVSETGTL